MKKPERVAPTEAAQTAGEKISGDFGSAAATWVSTDTLVPWSSNPRDNDRAVAKVRQSIERFGFGAPIVARHSDRRVIAGHTRLKAAIEIGMPTVPVRFLELTDEEAAVLALADNRLGTEAEWNWEKLAGVLRSIGEGARSLTGFDPHEIAPLLSADFARPSVAAAPPLNPSPYSIELTEAERVSFETALAANRAENGREVRAGEFVAWLASEYRR